MRILKIIFILLIGAYGVCGAFHQDAFCILNGANLLIHEAGHSIFGIFGEYVSFWGGTVMQLLMPAAFIGYFFYHNQKYSASVALWWFGQNFFHIAPYIKDARVQVLPLIGGGEHDWNYILYSMKVLQYDQQIGNAVWAAGLMIILLSVYCGIYYSKESQG